jgi:autotransporter-associated beta strand protein
MQASTLGCHSRICRKRFALRNLFVISSAAAAAILTGPGRSSATTPGVTLIPIASNAYGTDDTNSCGVTRNNLVTIGNYQYTAYYKYNSNSNGTIMVGRRATNSTSWTLVQTPYTLSNSGDSLYSGAIDDHDVVAMAVDGNGDIHLSWGMHNDPLNYAISTPSNGSTFNPTFTTQTASNNPALFSQFTSSGIYQATYPEFYYIPGAGGTPSGNLVFDYRNAASQSGGGSGNGNTYFGIYNASTSSYTTAPAEVLDGGITSVNGYQNRLAYDSNGNLDMTWTWRSTPTFQTNNNILFAQSPNNGITWYQQGGTTKYTLPIISDTSNGGSSAQVAQIVKNVAQNSSLINQSSMTVDKNSNPVLATWLTPNGTASLPVSATNNPNLQYELIYYTGTAWAASQITHRTSDTSFDTGGNDVRDLGRPIVLVDSSNRVLVIGRSEDTSMGSYSNAATPNNNLTVYWNTMSSLDSASPAPWKSFPLDTANMGEYEPSYDPTAWISTNTLSLFYEPVGLSGETTGTAQVLQWAESTFNFSSASPSVMTWDANTSLAGIQDGSGIWDYTHTNFSDGNANYAWNTTFAQSAVFGGANAAAGTVTLGTNVTASSLIFNAAASGNYNIGNGPAVFTLTLNANPTIVANVNATISAPISTTGTFTKTGAGILTLSGSNSLGSTITLGTITTSGGNVNGGLCVTTAAALGGVTQINFADGIAAYDIFEIDGTNGSVTIPNTISFTMNGSATVANANRIESVAGNNIFNGIINPNVYGNQYAVQSDAGTLTVNSNFNLGALTSARYLNLQGNGNGQWNGVLGNGTGGGPLGITKSGNGTWTLTNNETYTGLTNASAGTLVLASGASLAGAAINVSAGATFTAFGMLATNSALVTSGTVNLEPNATGGILTRTIASLNISSGGIANEVSANSSANRMVLITATPTLAGVTGNWQAQLNLGDNDLIAHNGSLTTLTNQLQQGYLSGTGPWNGSAGITSSAAAADSTHLTALGIAQNTLSGATSGTLLYGSGTPLGLFDGNSPVASDVLIKFTYNGDTNLDGKVDGTDYSRIDAGFLSNGSMTGWYNGDFNYDGVINGSDYTLIDNTFNRQRAAITATIESAQITAQIAPSPPSPVPEPTALPAAATTLLLLRRREKNGVGDRFYRNKLQYLKPPFLRLNCYFDKSYHDNFTPAASRICRKTLENR